MAVAETALPCPKCEYDLRGLEDGRCPECGTPFQAADLEPEQPGLKLEQWVEAAHTVRRRIATPWVIAFSPAKAFTRRCRLQKTLFVSPAGVLCWTLAWYVCLMILCVASHYALNRVQGLRLVIGGYWNPSLGHRFGSAVLLPVHLPIAWSQCVIVSVIGMAVAGRGLQVRQVMRLGTWLLPFTLLGGLFSILYEPLWYRVISPWLFPWFTDWMFRTRDVASELTWRGHDLVLGLSAGIAVGTVFRKRRWITVVVSTVVLVAAFPVYVAVQRAFVMSVYEPVRELVVGPRPAQPPGPMLLLGPTFTVGTADPALAGRWSLRYGEDDRVAAELAFDETGALTRVDVFEPAADIAELVADGQQHETSPPDEAENITAFSYRVLSGCERAGSRIVLHVRIERTYARELAEDVHEEILDVSEETLSGVLDEGGKNIAGTSVTVRDVPGILFEPGELRQSFMMERVSSANLGRGP